MKFKRIAMWVISIIMGLMFLYAGGSKLAADKMHVDAFNRYGIPLWFMYVTGVVEVTAGILILIPKTRFWGAALLVGTMVGALIIHIRAGEYNVMVIPGILLLVAVLIGWVTRPDWVKRIIF